MEKPPPSRMSIIAGIAAAMGIHHIPSTAFVLQKKRGRAPKGKVWVSSSVYIPAGAGCNVDSTITRNPKIIAHVNMMHEKWWAAKQVQEAAKANGIRP